MADDPWAVVGTEPAQADDPWAVVGTAPHEPHTDALAIAKDTGKSILSEGARGALMIPGFAGDMSDLLARGSKAAGDYIGGKMGLSPSAALSENNILPTTKDLQSDVEKITGPFYQPQTPTGKLFGGAASVIPGLALGGTETIPGLIAKAVGSGAASEGAGEAADALKGNLPTVAQPYAEPVARAVGAVAGAFSPAGIRRGITLNPASDAQLTAIGHLPADFPMTAGQRTESPGLMALEARSPRMQRIPGQQEQAFTGAAMNEAGIPSNNFQDIGQGQQVGAALGNLYRNSRGISVQDYPNLQNTINTERRNLIRTAGNGNTDSLDEVRDQVRFGAQNNGTPVFDMPGPRFQYMRGELQRRIDAAGSPEEKMALSRVRDQMDQSFAASNPTVAPQVDPLQRQYANYNVLKNIPPKAGQETITPQQVLSAVGHGWGNAAANTGQGTLAPLAQDASRVMTPLPTPTGERGPMTRLIGAGLGGLLGSGAGMVVHSPMHGADLAAVTAILGGERAGDVAEVAKNALGRVAGSRGGQLYLGNQLWRPGPHTTGDPSVIARMLLTPPVNRQDGQ